jgi:nitrogenase-associated protein
MVTVIFYEKPRCINNTKQKAMLQAAGHHVIARNLLSEPWTAQRLRPFFGVLPVSQWFNTSAPRIKSGEIIPEQLDVATALTLMIDDPLLIRRPLLQVGNVCCVGFDVLQIAAWIGLQTRTKQDLETCPRR